MILRFGENPILWFWRKNSRFAVLAKNKICGLGKTRFDDFV